MQHHSTRCKPSTWSLNRLAVAADARSNRYPLVFHRRPGPFEASPINTIYNQRYHPFYLCRVAEPQQLSRQIKLPFNYNFLASQNVLDFSFESAYSGLAVWTCFHDHRGLNAAPVRASTAADVTCHWRLADQSCIIGTVLPRPTDPPIRSARSMKLTSHFCPAVSGQRRHRRLERDAR